MRLPAKLAVYTILLLAPSIALAEPGKATPPGYNGQGNGHHYGHSAAPLPIAATGLPALALIGGAYSLMHWARRRSRRNEER